MQPQALKLQATMLENEGPHCRIRKSDTSVTSKHPTRCGWVGPQISRGYGDGASTVTRNKDRKLVIDSTLTFPAQTPHGFFFRPPDK